MRYSDFERIRVDRKVPFPENLSLALNCSTGEAEQVYGDLPHLSERQLGALQKIFVEHKTKKQAAEEMNLTQYWFESALASLVARLKDQLEQIRNRKNKKVFLNIYALAKLSEREYQELRALAYDKERSEETGIDAFNNLDGFKWPEWFVNRVLNNLEVIKDSYIPDDCWSDLDKEVFEEEKKHV